MTVPWLMNCSHREDGWCLECAGNLGREYWDEQVKNQSLSAELYALRSQVAAALAADGQWMEQTGELRKQVARLRSLLARYREHVMAHESIDYLEHHTGMPPTSFLRADLALSADDADEIRTIGIETISDLVQFKKD